MHDWEEKCKEDGAVLVSDGVICQEEPDDNAVESCKALGKALAQSYKIEYNDAKRSREPVSGFRLFDDLPEISVIRSQNLHKSLLR